MMRGAGDNSASQGVTNGSSSNQYHEPPHRGREYTTSERAAISEKLERQLGPEWISSRPGPGGTKMYHLTVQKAIDLANQAFGFDGWSSSIVNTTVDYAIQDPESRRFNVGVSIIVRVTIRNGAFHEDIGYGTAENSKNMAMGFEHAKKSGASDALKRALKNFGNLLGNCIYDKQYLTQVTKMKAHPTKLDINKLHRHPDYAPKLAPPPPTTMAALNPTAPPAIPANITTTSKSATNGNGAAPRLDLALTAADSFDDEFGDFDVEDFGLGDESSFDHDAVALPASPKRNTAPPPAHTNTNEKVVAAPANPQATGQPAQAAPGPNARQPLSRNPSGAGRATTPQPDGNGNGNVRVLNQPSRMGPAAVILQQEAQRGNAPKPAEAAAPATVGFFSARAAMKVDDGAPASPDASLAFNPNAESPSIRKTAGIDHTKSKPLTKQLRHVPGGTRVDGAGSPRGNVINPQLDGARRIGAPHSPSPLANRNSYKPPTMAAKRNLDGTTTPAEDSRAPLGDLPANEMMTVGDGVDAKRMKRAA